MFKEIVPEVRFTGFEGTLKSNYIKKIASFSKGRGYTKNDLKNSGHPVLLYGQLYTDFKFVLESVMQFTTLKPNSVLSTGREVVVPASGETAEDLARASAIIKPGIILGGDLNIVTPTNDLIPEYLAMNLTSRNPSKRIEEMAQGKSIVHIRNNNLKEIKINYPSKKEQRKIANYIILIDEVIKLKETEISKVSNFKQAMLQRMFPKEGEAVPEVRFEGFNEDWKLLKFIDIGTIGMNKRIYKSETTDDGDIPFYKIGTFGKKADTYITKERYEEYKKLYPYPKLGDVLISASGTIGRTVEYNGEDAYFQDSNIIWLQHDDDIITNTFLKFYYEVIKWDGIEGSTIKRLYNDNFLNTKVMHPRLDEQKLIGNYFKTLEKNIQSKQAELDKLKQFKQAMLDKMFV